MKHPENPDIEIKTEEEAEESVERIMKFLKNKLK